MKRAFDTQPLQSRQSSWSTSLLRFFLLLLPPPLRVLTYQGLCAIGIRLWGRSTPFGGVQRLPFGLYAKYSPSAADGHKNEFRALQLVRQHTDIPVPEPIDLVCARGESFLITSEMPGAELNLVWPSLTANQKNQLTMDLRTFLFQLRQVRNPFTHAICNAAGEGLLDCRLPNNVAGPFKNESEFNESLRLPNESSLTHSASHSIYFCHGDLNPRNILVEDGKISGLVDWEFSGWFPEYWDYTKAYYVTHWREWLDIVDTVFQRLTGSDHPYLVENEIEGRFQDLGNPW